MWDRQISEKDRLQSLEADRDELEKKLEQTESDAKKELLIREINRIDSRISAVRDDLFNQN